MLSFNNWGWNILPYWNNWLLIDLQHTKVIGKDRKESTLVGSKIRHIILRPKLLSREIHEFRLINYLKNMKINNLLLLFSKLIKLWNGKILLLITIFLNDNLLFHFISSLTFLNFLKWSTRCVLWDIFSIINWLYYNLNPISSF